MQNKQPASATPPANDEVLVFHDLLDDILSEERILQLGHRWVVIAYGDSVEGGEVFVARASEHGARRSAGWESFNGKIVILDVNESTEEDLDEDAGTEKDTEAVSEAKENWKWALERAKAFCAILLAEDLKRYGAGCWEVKDIDGDSNNE